MTAATAGSVHRYVIQKHDATRLHYDLRLEMEGVYRSWAVPKGLPTESGERNLAVEVEDHPLEYGKFEGTIPAGNYGAGTVMLWDRGHYTVASTTPERAYRDGKIHFALAGEKCVGEWTLIRLPRRGGEAKTNWLVMKNKAAEHAARRQGADRDLSVLSGRSMEEIATGKTGGRTARSKPPARNREPARTGRTRGPSARPPATGAKSRTREPRVAPRKNETDAPAGKKARTARRSRRTSREDETRAPAEFIPPMKALNVDVVPAGKWRLEIKLDGFRAIAVINQGHVELWSRNHKPLTGDYPEVVAALEQLSCANAVIDGEIVALDAQGRSRFQLLQNRGAASRPAIVYYAFDLLQHDGRSLLASPIEERQAELEGLVGAGTDALRVSPVFDVPPPTLLAKVRQQGLEGIIAKTPGSVYEPDRRSGTWLKCKVQGEQEFVIGGFTPPKNSRPYFGALLVGYYDGRELRYAGKVGSGFDHARLASLHRELTRRQINMCPFADLPATRRSRFGTGMTSSVMRQVTWVKPELVAQIRFTEWTEEGSLRHPVFLGLRDDKEPQDVVRESGGAA